MPDDQNEIEGEPSSMLTNAMNKSSRFNAIYNEIPLFSIDNNNNSPSTDAAGSRPKASVDQKMLNNLVSSHYMFFSSQNMLTAMEQLDENDASSESDLLSLRDLLERMSTESTTDFRNIVLVPSTPITDGPVSDAVFQTQLEDPVSFIGGNFFHSLF